MIMIFLYFSVNLSTHSVGVLETSKNTDIICQTLKMIEKKKH